MTALQQVEQIGARAGHSAIGGTPLRRAAAACESVEEIINTLATAEALAVTALGRALGNAASGQLALNGEQVQMLTAARAQEEAHYRLLTSMGARPVTTAFTLPENVVTEVPTFLKTLIWLEELSIAAYLAAGQEFGILNHPQLVQLALSIASVEAEHRVGVRFFAVEAGVITGLPNDIAFQQALFTSVGQAAAALRQKGFIGGSGSPITYPGTR